MSHTSVNYKVFGTQFTANCTNFSAGKKKVVFEKKKLRACLEATPIC